MQPEAFYNGRKTTLVMILFIVHSIDQKDTLIHLHKKIAFRYSIFDLFYFLKSFVTFTEKWEILTL